MAFEGKGSGQPKLLKATRPSSGCCFRDLWLSQVSSSKSRSHILRRISLGNREGHNEARWKRAPNRRIGALALEAFASHLRVGRGRTQMTALSGSALGRFRGLFSRRDGAKCLKRLKRRLRFGTLNFCLQGFSRAKEGCYDPF